MLRLILATAILQFGSVFAETCAPPEFITLREFSLETLMGNNVFHKVFDRRRLSDDSERLTLKFDAGNKHFEFEFERSSVFAPNAVVRTIGHVRLELQILPMLSSHYTA